MKSAEELKDEIIKVLRSVYDPEIPMSLYDLGLIYKIELLPLENTEKHEAIIDMTLTAPGCPMADMLVENVRVAVDSLPDVESTTVNLVWNPPWDKSRLSDEAKLHLNLF